MIGILVFLSFVFSSVHADDIFNATELPSSLDKLQSQNELTVDLSALPSSIVNGCVNVITGDYFEHVTDISLPGTAGVELQRSYSSGSCKRGTLQWGWDINHGGKLLCQEGKHHRYCYLKGTERNGTSYQSAIKEDRLSVSDQFIKRGVTNIIGGEISANTNLKKDTLKNAADFFYKLESANHTIYTFNRSQKDWDEKKGIEVFNLSRTRLPNGLTYNYTYAEGQTDALTSLEVHGGGITRGTLHIKDIPESPHIPWKYSYVADNEHYSSTYDFKSFANRSILEHVNSFQAPPISYTYENVRGHSSWLRLIERKLPDNRYLSIKYFAKDSFKIDKVHSLYAPSGPNEKTTKIYEFDYQEGHNFCITEAIDANEILTRYKWGSKEKRLHSIEHLDRDKKSTFNERCFWIHPEKPYLKGIVWEHGTGEVIAGRHLKYTRDYNVAIDTLYGNLTGRCEPYFFALGLIPSELDKYPTSYTYDSRLRCESQIEGGIKTEFTYKGDTDLITAKLTSYEGRIQIREFFDYDDAATIILEIIDDGSRKDRDDLTDVHERRIKRIENNILGQPIQIQELALDLSTGHEALIKQTENRYGNDLRLNQQVIFDSNNEASHQLFWEYDGHGNVTLETNASGFTTRKAYDANDNLIEEIRPGEEASRHYTYDCMNRLITEEYRGLDGSKFIKTFEYDPMGQLVSSSDIFGNKTSYAYDHLGHLQETIYPEVYAGNPIIKQTCDPFGHITSLTDPKGNTTTSTYNARGKPLRITYPNGSFELFFYTLSGELEEATYRDQTKVKYTYDPQGRETKALWFNPEGTLIKTLEKTYSAFHLLSETDELGTVTHYSYDPAGRLASKRVGNRITTYNYDSLGRESEIREWLEDGNWLSHRKVYNKQDLVVLECTEDSFAQECSRTEYGYNEAGKCIFKKMSNGGTSSTQYDAYMRVVLEVDPLGQETRHQYNLGMDAYGQAILVHEITDSRGVKTALKHDALGRVVSKQITSPFGDVVEAIDTHYDLNGIRIKQLVHTEKEPVVTLFEYDSMGSLVQSIEASGTLDEKKLSRTYDTAGRLISLKKADGVVLTYAYDPFGRISSLDSSDKTLAFRYFYDLNGNLISAQDQVHNICIERRFDIYNQLIAETMPVGTIKYEYDPIGRLINLILPDESTLQTSYQGIQAKSIKRKGKRCYEHHYLAYDSSLKPLQVLLPEQGGLCSYSYDILERPLEIATAHWKESLTFESNLVAHKNLMDDQGSLESRFTYDALKQLLTETGSAEHSFSYDLQGNAISFDGSSRLFNSRNALIKHFDCSYTYDLNGNRISDGKITYKYDALDRLIEVNIGDETYCYFYDPTGRRVSKSHGNETIHYLWQNEEEVGALSADKTLLEFKALNPQHRSIALEMEDHVYIPILDAYGHIRTLLDSSTGNVCSTYRYSAFGEEQVYGNILSPWRFANKRIDPETGLIYFGKRYYDPSTFTWISPDPIDDADGPNLYAYVHHNPLLYVDNDGCFSLTSWIKSHKEVLVQAVATAVVVSTVIGWGAVGLAEGFLSGCSDGIVGTCIDLAVDGTTLYNQGGAAAAFAEADAATRAYHTFKIAGRVGGAVYGSCTPQGKATQLAMNAGSTAMKAMKATTRIASTTSKAASAANKSSRAVQKIGTVAKKERLCLDSFSKAGEVMDRGGLTAAGRSLDKHGGRVNSIFQKATGNVLSKNTQGQFQLDDILTHPNGYSKPNKLGGIDFYRPDGSGVRFYSDGKFRGFLEPSL